MASLTSASSVLFEAVVTPNSDLEDRTLKGINFRQRFGATTLAIRRGEDVREKIGRMRLRVGDELLIVAPRRNLERLREESSFIDANGKAAINFQISVSIYGFVALILVFVLVGIPLLVALGIFTLVVVIMAAIKASNGEEFNYPLSIRFLK